MKTWLKTNILLPRCQTKCPHSSTPILAQCLGKIQFPPFTALWKTKRVSGQRLFQRANLYTHIISTFFFWELCTPGLGFIQATNWINIDGGNLVSSWVPLSCFLWFTNVCCLRTISVKVLSHTICSQYELGFENWPSSLFIQVHFIRTFFFLQDRRIFRTFLLILVIKGRFLRTPL